jgi:hypothetical protein
MDARFAPAHLVNVHSVWVDTTSTVDPVLSVILTAKHATHIPFAPLAIRATIILHFTNGALLVQQSVVPAAALLLALHVLLVTFTMPLTYGATAVLRAVAAAQIVRLALPAMLASYYIVARVIIAH